MRQRGLSRTRPSVVRGRAIVSRRTSSAVTGTAGSLPGRAVDRFAQQVRMPVVPGVLLDHVEIEPAHIALVAAVVVLRAARDDLVKVLAAHRGAGRGALLLVGGDDVTGRRAVEVLEVGIRPLVGGELQVEG